MTAAVVIPYRDRGTDPLRQANLDRVLDWWADSPYVPHVVSDGRESGAQFNRSAAYNRAVAEHDADAFVFTEADMLVPLPQIATALAHATMSPGLVVGFTQYRYLSEVDSAHVRKGARPDWFTPESTMDNGRSVGAVNVVSRKTLELAGGWDETFEGSWYDDRAAKIAFEKAAGPTRWVDGPAWHLYHQPGWKGPHLTDEDRAATARNKARLALYRRARTADDIRALTA